MSWSDADYAEAKRLWAAGESATTIAVVVGRSRNAVCGMVHRNPADFPKRRTRRTAPVAFEDVPSGRCRWPVDLRLDAPCGPAMVVCGAPVSHAGSKRSMARTHCPMHLAKAGQSPVRRGG